MATLSRASLPWKVTHPTARSSGGGHARAVRGAGRRRLALPSSQSTASPVAAAQGHVVRRASNAPESSGPCAQPIGCKSPSRGQPVYGVVSACGRRWRGAGVARQVERGASLEHCRSERTEAPAAARRRAGAARRRCWSQRAGAEGRSVGELVAGRGRPTSGVRSIVRAAVALRALRRLRSTPPSARSRALERDVGGPTRRHRCTTSGACHGLRVTPSWASLRADLGPLEPRPRRRPHHAVHGEEMVIFDGMAGPARRPTDLG